MKNLVQSSSDQMEIITLLSLHIVRGLYWYNHSRPAQKSRYYSTIGEQAMMASLNRLNRRLASERWVSCFRIHRTNVRSAMEIPSFARIASWVLQNFPGRGVEHKSVDPHYCHWWRTCSKLSCVDSITEFRHVNFLIGSLLPFARSIVVVTVARQMDFLLSFVLLW
jgi:hypothetical protein